MNILPGYSYLIVIAAFFQGFLVLLVIFLFIERFINSRQKKVAEELIKEEAYREAQKILESARASSYQTVKSSQEKANFIVSQAYISAESAQKQLDSTLQNLIKQHSDAFNKYLSAFSTDFADSLRKEEVASLASFDESCGEMRKEVSTQIVSYSETIQRNTLEAEKGLKEHLEKDLSVLRSKLNDYESAKMTSIDDKIFKILTKVSHDALGKTLSLTDHEDLIMQLLDQAKLEDKFQS